ncbi:MAG: AMP-binding protein, partial [Xanthomonadales bacterium]|nr:AMP-binding protein [Xanthomonadales bacterium]
MALMRSLLESVCPSDQIVARDSTRSITAESLLAKANALAEELESLGIRVLALQLDNGIDWLMVDLASQMANICLIPLPGFFSSIQIAHVLSKAPVDAYMGDGIAGIEPLLGNRLQHRHITLVGALPLLQFATSAEAFPLPPNTGKVTFTSGSTGTPKGVCLSHPQLLLQAHALSEAVGLAKPRHLCLLPLSTLLENVAGIYSPLLCGGEVILPRLAEIGFAGSSELNPQKFVQTISRYQPHSIILTPQLLLVLVSAAEAGWQPPASLQFVAVGGGKVAASLLQQAHQAGIPAYEGYGLSECASVVSLNTPLQHQQGSCGRPLPHLQLSIEDGEIVVAGNAMLGFLGEPESWGQTAIRTGDLGSVNPDGYVHINGRSKNLLISSYGRNINPEWVESELLSQPLLSECVVLGDARPYCVALLTPRQSYTRDDVIQQHIDRVNLGLPDYARIKRWHRLSQPLSQPLSKTLSKTLSK